jgi:glycosyltransferase involved in cell wall biosynthesis
VSQPPITAETDVHTIRANYAQFRSLVAGAEHSRDADKLEEAAALASASARFAWFNHTGVFSDGALERLLVDLSRRVPDIGPSAPQAPIAGRRVVLHVATELYPTGGHTQMLSRWIAGDSQSEHRIALTRQGWRPIPDKVARLLVDRPIYLDSRARSHLQRAAALRRICHEADVVVVHAHPDDIQPALALAATTKPCIVVNHASHVFWAGVSIARTTLHLRRSAQELAVARRGLPADAGFVVNRPLAFPEVDLRRAEARAHFGIADGQVVIATAAATGTKYEPLEGGDNLVELLVRQVASDPQLIVLAAGPRAEGQWLSAQEATAGRVRALGSQRSVGSLLAAADIYIDSFPFSSITSLLEAGAYGLPLVSYRGHGPGCEVLSADPPAIEDGILYPKTPDEVDRVVSALAASTEVRESRGALLRDIIAATHSGAAWQEAVESLYEFAQRPAGAEGAVDIGDIAPQSFALDCAVSQIQQRSAPDQGVDVIYRSAMGSMPFGARLETWNRLRHSGLRFGVREFLREVDRVRLQKTGYLILRCIRPKWVDARLG